MENLELNNSIGMRYTGPSRRVNTFRQVVCSYSITCALLLGLTACEKSEPAKERVATAPRESSPRLVVLYMTCSLNASYLQPYTPSVTYTPNFEKFSEDALTFQKHYTESGFSGTAFSSILTGSHADIHQVYYHPNPIASGVEILPQVLESRGYSPNYWISHSMANAAVRPKLEAALAVNTRNILRSNNRRLELLLDQLQKNNEEQVVITIAFTVTHAPYKIDNLKKFIATYPNESGLLTGFTLSRIEHLQQIYLEHRFVFSYGSQDQIDALDHL